MTDRLYDDLAKHFGSGNVFRDEQSILGGQNFTHAIKDALESASTLLVVIGKSWLQELKTRTEQNKSDWVHSEIKMGLDRQERDKLQIIPVLIDNTPFPSQQDLPEVLHPFAYITATPLRSGRDYADDLEHLIGLIASHIGIEVEEMTAVSPVMLVPDNPLSSPSIALTPDHHEPVAGDPIQPDEHISVSRTQALVEHLRSNWQFWLGTMLLPIVLLIVGFAWTASQSQNSTTPPTATLTPAPFAATVYYGRALTLHFEGESNLTSVGLLTDKNHDAPNRLDDDFQQYFPGGAVEKAVCLQYAVEGAEASSPPRACRELDLRTVTLSDPFWTDTTNDTDTDTMLPIQFLKGERQLGAICEPDGGPCIIAE